MGVAADRADDVVQDVFLVVHKQLPSFEGRSKLETWLFAITYRVVQEHWRRIARSARPDPTAKPDVSDRGFAQLEAAELLDHLLADLDHDKRAVFVMSELQGMQASEIAEALDLSPNTVSSRLRLARERLARSLARYRARERGARSG